MELVCDMHQRRGMGLTVSCTGSRGAASAAGARLSNATTPRALASRRGIVGVVVFARVLRVVL
jgi:hypothetical protein